MNTVCRKSRLVSARSSALPAEGVGAGEGTLNSGSAQAEPKVSSVQSRLCFSFADPSLTRSFEFAA